MPRPELLRHRPSPEAPAVAEALAGQRVGVLAETEDLLYVEAPSGQRGWIAKPRTRES